MTAISNKRSWWRRGQREEDRALTRETLPPAMLDESPGAGLPLSPGGALRVADAYACVRCLADAAGSLPLIAYRLEGDDRARLTGGLSDLLAAPAPAMTQANLVSQIVAHLNLYGNAFVGKYRGPGGTVAQLGLFSPDRVAVALRAGRPVYTVTHAQGEQTTHGPEDILHIRGMTTDGLLGLSPIRQARTVIGLSGDAAVHARGFFRNGGRPSGIIRVGGDVNGQGDTLREELKDSFRNSHGTPEKAQGIAVITGDVDFVPLSMPADDAQFIEQRRLSAVEVARVFRVPPWMIGAETGDSMTYSNVESQGLAFVTYSLRPWLVVIEQAINADPDLCQQGVFVEFLLDALLRADSKTRADVYALALDPERGWMSRDEVRRRENLPAERTRNAPTIE